jgi:hypothetical protein
MILSKKSAAFWDHALAPSAGDLSVIEGVWLKAAIDWTKKIAAGSAGNLACHINAVSRPDHCSLAQSGDFRYPAENRLALYFE